MDPFQAKLGESRNVERICMVMEALSKASAQGMRLTDVVEATGLGKTTAHRILGSLAAQALVEQDAETGRFFVGLRMLAWAAAARNRFTLARLAEPILERVARRTGDTIYLVMRVGDEVVCLDSREGSFPIKALTLNIGDSRPLGVGAGSLAILAALPDEEVERIMASDAPARTRFAFKDHQLREMIAATRRDGYAYNNMHVFEGMEKVTEMAGVAVPIRRRDGLPIAALGISAITSRLDPPRREPVLAGLRKEATALEAAMEPVLSTFGTRRSPLHAPGA